MTKMIEIEGELYDVIKLLDAFFIVDQLAEIYTVDTDQVHLIRLVAEAKRLMGKK